MEKVCAYSCHLWHLNTDSFGEFGKSYMLCRKKTKPLVFLQYLWFLLTEF